MNKFYFLIFTVFYFNQIKAQLLAFPTAEGAGKFVTGGRGSVSTAPKVFEVTSLVDDATSATTPGTLRYACTNNSPSAPNRIIVFRVSGTIHLYTTLTLTRANTTIAGQTAPGEGICIADYPVYIGTSNFIVRYIRFRLGDKNQNLGMINGSGDGDAFGDNGNGRTNVIIDHCSMSWSDDEAFTLYSGDNVTLQWNFIEEPLNYSYHFETGDPDYENHAYGGIWGAKHGSYHHNLIAHIKGRGPRFDGIRNIAADTGDFRNNVIFDWLDYNTNGGEGGKYNVVNNYYKYGPNTPSSVTSGVNRRNMLLNPYKSTSPVIPYGKYYLTGNYCDNSAAVTDNNWLGAAMSGGSYADTTTAKATTAFSCISINTETALQAYISVLANAGCSLPHRDTLDQRITNDVKNRTGRIIDVQGGYPHGTPYATTVNAWPALATGTAQPDTDHDGMPDRWETARGLNASSNTDLNGYISTSGYPNIENYINGDTIVAAGTLNTCVTARGVLSSASNQWLHARDTSYSYYLSPVYTSSVDSNHIVASILDNANFGPFDISYFTSSGLRNDGFGHYYLNRNVTISPQFPDLISQPVTVRLYISKAEFDALKTADPTISTINDIKIIKSNDNSCINALPSVFTSITPVATGTFGTYQNGYYLEFQTNSFSTFFFASKLSPIPVKLGYFDVEKINSNEGRVRWGTQQELNSKNFLVQRSQDAASWKTIANLPAAGNSSIPKSYIFSDLDDKKGSYYYRLLQNDLDGKSFTSETRKLNFGDDRLNVQVYPNPAKDELKLYVADARSFEYTLLDITGRKLMYASVNSNNVIVDIHALPSGSYTVCIKTAGQSVNNKFIKY